MRAIPILVIAAAQGWLLSVLHDAAKYQTWPATQPGWLLALYALALLVPATLHMLAGWLRRAAAWLASGAVALVAGGLAGYAGWTLAPNEVRFQFVVPLYAALIAAWFIALPFVQARLRQGTWQVSYPGLFESAWQNALVLAEAALFTGVFWLLLWLWALLFKVIDIAFFANLFAKPGFFYPVSAIAFGYAVHLVESNEKIVLTLRRHLLGVFSWLLPLVALIAVLFLLALPFTGLQPLWRTGHATSLMLWLQLAFIFFLNSAYQDGQAEPHYPSWMKIALRACVLGLPVYAALCAYSLGLRVEQHGWTVSRVWAALGTALAVLYGLGYAAAALRGSRWMGSLARINVAMALSVGAVLLLVVSPALDPRRLSAESQAERLRSGSVLPAQFDFDYLRFELGRHGRQALAALAANPDGEIARLASASLAKTARYQPVAAVPPRLLASRIELLPAGTALDPAFVKYLEQAVEARPHQHPGCLRQMTPRLCIMLAIDLNGDGEPEIVSFSDYSQPVYGKVNGRWQRIGLLATPRYAGAGAENLIRQGRIRTEPRAWQDLVVGEFRYTMHPEQ